MVTYGSPFGGAARTRTLVALRLMGASYSRELARVLGSALSGVQAALRGLERDGLVAGRAMGRTRVYELNPRYFAKSELAAFLDKLGTADVELRRQLDALRRRPRRSAKPL